MAARAMWSGSISFGLVTLPVKLYTAVDDGSAVSFRMICREHEAPVKMPRVCSTHGEELPADAIVKGYADGEGLTILEPSDLDDLPLATAKELRLDQFVPSPQVLGNPALIKATYNVGPDKVGRRAFAMLRSALRESGRAGIGKVALRGGREQRAALISDGTNLQLVLLHWADQVRDASDFADDEVIAPAELQMACNLIETMASDLDLTGYTDDYSMAVQAVVEAKRSGTAKPAPVAPRANTSDDLMAALTASIAAAEHRAETYPASKKGVA